MIVTTRHGGPDAGVLELRLARPPVNALDPGFVEALHEALAHAYASAAQQRVGALVISGRPGMFSAGLDVPALLALDRAGMARFWQRFFGLMRQVAESPLPIAAAFTGHSPAGGTVLGLFCDARFAADGEYKIGLNEVQVGLCVPPVVLAAFERVVGPRNAAFHAVQGTLMSPQNAFEIGLVDEVLHLDAVVPRAIAWAEALAKLPPNAVARTRAFVRQPLIDAVRALEASTNEQMTEVWFSTEAQGALRAMVERLKKKP
jgi:enoyl-CoA hydratase/carnithine racemase